LTKYIIILIVGAIETYFSTNWALFAVERKAILSSLMMFIYLTIYLLVISWAVKDNDTIAVMIVYAFSGAIGNYISIKADIYNKNGKKTTNSPILRRLRKNPPKKM
jgi:uncharacterized protein YebE (UPF0316 family)